MSTVLTENVVLSRTRNQDLRNVRKLNCWGNELTDVSIIRSLVNVEVLSLSLNNIKKLADFAHCPYLQELYLRKNQIKDINEIHHLKRLSYLRKLWLAENPCADFPNYRMTVLRALPKLEMLDNICVTEEEVREARTAGKDVHDPNSINDEIPEPEEKVYIEDDQNEADEYDEDPTDDGTELDQDIERVRTISYRDGHTFQQGSPKVQRFSYPSTQQELNGSPNKMLQQQQSSSHAAVIRSSSISDYSSQNGQQLQQQQVHDVPHQVDNRIPSAYGPPIESSPYNIHQQQQLQQATNGLRYICGGGGGRGSTSSPISTIPAKTSSHSSNSAKMLSKGGRNRNANILSAVLCLIKDLDFASLEVVETAIHCQMEEMDETSRHEGH